MPPEPYRRAAYNNALGNIKMINTIERSGSAGRSERQRGMNSRSTFTAGSANSHSQHAAIQQPNRQSSTSKMPSARRAPRADTGSIPRAAVARASSSYTDDASRAPNDDAPGAPTNDASRAPTLHTPAPPSPLESTVKWNAYIAWKKDPNRSTKEETAYPPWRQISKNGKPTILRTNTSKDWAFLAINDKDNEKAYLKEVDSLVAKEPPPSSRHLGNLEQYIAQSKRDEVERDWPPLERNLKPLEYYLHQTAQWQVLSEEERANKVRQGNAPYVQKRKAEEELERLQKAARTNDVFTAGAASRNSLSSLSTLDGSPFLGIFSTTPIRLLAGRRLAKPHEQAQPIKRTPRTTLTPQSRMPSTQGPSTPIPAPDNSVSSTNPSTATASTDNNDKSHSAATTTSSMSTSSTASTSPSQKTKRKHEDATPCPTDEARPAKSLRGANMSSPTSSQVANEMPSFIIDNSEAAAENTPAAEPQRPVRRRLNMRNLGAFNRDRKSLGLEKAVETNIVKEETAAKVEPSRNGHEEKNINPVDEGSETKVAAAEHCHEEIPVTTDEQGHIAPTTVNTECTKDALVEKTPEIVTKVNTKTIKTDNTKDSRLEKISNFVKKVPETKSSTAKGRHENISMSTAKQAPKAHVDANAIVDLDYSTGEDHTKKNSKPAEKDSQAQTVNHPTKNNQASSSNSFTDASGSQEAAGKKNSAVMLTSTSAAGADRGLQPTQKREVEKEVENTGASSTDVMNTTLNAPSTQSNENIGAHAKAVETSSTSSREAGIAQYIEKRYAREVANTQNIKKRGKKKAEPQSTSEGPTPRAYPENPMHFFCRFHEETNGNDKMQTVGEIRAATRQPTPQSPTGQVLKKKWTQMDGACDDAEDDQQAPQTVITEHNPWYGSFHQLLKEPGFIPAYAQRATQPAYAQPPSSSRPPQEPWKRFPYGRIPLEVQKQQERLHNQRYFHATLDETTHKPAAEPYTDSHIPQEAWAAASKRRRIDWSTAKFVDVKEVTKGKMDKKTFDKVMDQAKMGPYVPKGAWMEFGEKRGVGKDDASNEMKGRDGEH